VKADTYDKKVQKNLRANRLFWIIFAGAINENFVKLSLIPCNVADFFIIS